MPAQISVADSDTLYQLFPLAHPDEEIELDEKADAIIEALQAMKEDYKSLEGKIGQQENVIKAMLQEAASGKTDRYRVTWKNTTRKAYSVAEKSFRTLRVKEIKKEG